MARPSAWAAGPAALVLLFSALTAANAEAERVSDNIILVRDKPGTPTQFNVIVHAGCYNEAGGHCRGLSHYLEHLVLTGRNPEHKEAGVRLIPDGDMNGITSQRFTRYYHTAPARADGPRADLELLFNFYAGRLRDFSITPEDALRERNVVRQEYDWRTGSQARVRFLHTLNKALLPDHPAGSFGTADDIEAYTVDDARAFHRQWYMPSNATFVIKGDIEPQALREIADRALGGLEERPHPRRPQFAPPEIVLERKDFREQDPQATRSAVYVKKLVRMEEGGDLLAERAARLVVLAFAQSRLAGSLNEVLVDRDKLAVGSVGFAITRIAPRTIAVSVTAVVAPDADPDKLRLAIETYIEGLAERGISDAAIVRLKTRAVDAIGNGDKDPNAVYGRLVGWLAAGDRFETFAQWPQAFAAVTPFDVAAVLQRVSSAGRIVTGILTPPVSPVSVP
jgi:zinc protease